MVVLARNLFFCWIVFALAGSASAAPLQVVASFSILGDMVAQVGGDRVRVTTLVGADSDAHAYEPTPAAVKEVRAAALVVVNGLGFEGWLDRLITVSGYKGPVVVTSAEVNPRGMKDAHGHGGAGGHDQHTIDPHAWQSLDNGRLYVEAIARGLSGVDPEGAGYYDERAAAYIRRLAEIDAWARAEFSSIPDGKRRMITSHDAFGYLGDAYGIEILSPMGAGTASEPSAGGVRMLIKQIKAEKITAVFVENISNPRMIEQIARESGVTVGGELYSDALSGANGPAASYLDMFQNNIRQIIATMKQGL